MINSTLAHAHQPNSGSSAIGTKFIGAFMLAWRLRIFNVLGTYRSFTPLLITISASRRRRRRRSPEPLSTRTRTPRRKVLLQGALDHLLSEETFSSKPLLSSLSRLCACIDACYEPYIYLLAARCEDYTQHLRRRFGKMLCSLFRPRFDVGDLMTRARDC